MHLRVAYLRIRIRREVGGILDGVSLSHLFPGLVYEVPDSLAAYLLSTGDAEEAHGSFVPIDPDDEVPDRPIFGGGISVTGMPDRADDRPRARAKPRRRRRTRRLA